MVWDLDTLRLWDFETLKNINGWCSVYIKGTIYSGRVPLCKSCSKLEAKGFSETAFPLNMLIRWLRASFPDIAPKESLCWHQSLRISRISSLPVFFSFISLRWWFPKIAGGPSPFAMSAICWSVIFPLSASLKIKLTAPFPSLSSTLSSYIPILLSVSQKAATRLAIETQG